MMTSAQVVETSVNVTSNSPSQDYTHPDDHNLPNYDMTPGFKPFTRKDLPCDKILAVFQFLRLAFPLPTNGWQNIEEIPKTWNLKSMKLSQRRLNALDNFNI